MQAIKDPMEALEQCVEEARIAAQLPMKPAAIQMLRERCGNDFKKQLKNDLGKWDLDGPLVRRMAWWVGVVAHFLAEAEGDPEIEEATARAALLFVRQHCNVRLIEGGKEPIRRRYCESAAAQSEPSSPTGERG